MAYVFEKYIAGDMPLHYNLTETLFNVAYEELFNWGDPPGPYRNSLGTSDFSRTPKVGDEFSLVFTDNKGNKVYSFAIISGPPNVSGFTPFVMKQAMLLHNNEEISELKEAIAGLKTENWTFTLEDGSTVTKKVYVV